MSTTKGKNTPTEKCHFESWPGKASLKAKSRLMRQIYACQASSEKKPWKNINTDGNEIADLQETMRSDSSAVSPHLIWQPGLRGNAAAKSAGALGRCVSAPEALCRKSWCLQACDSARGVSKLWTSKLTTGLIDN